MKNALCLIAFVLSCSAVSADPVLNFRCQSDSGRTVIAGNETKIRYKIDNKRVTFFDVNGDLNERESGDLLVRILASADVSLFTLQVYDGGSAEDARFSMISSGPVNLSADGHGGVTGTVRAIVNGDKQAQDHTPPSPVAHNVLVNCDVASLPPESATFWPQLLAQLRNLPSAARSRLAEIAAAPENSLLTQMNCRGGDCFVAVSTYDADGTDHGVSFNVQTDGAGHVQSVSDVQFQD